MSLDTLELKKVIDAELQSQGYDAASRVVEDPQSTTVEVRYRDKRYRLDTGEVDELVRHPKEVAELVRQLVGNDS